MDWKLKFNSIWLDHGHLFIIISDENLENISEKNFSKSNDFILKVNGLYLSKPQSKLLRYDSVIFEVSFYLVNLAYQTLIFH